MTSFSLLQYTDAVQHGRDRTGRQDRATPRPAAVPRTARCSR
jgi:hypothetical protein